MAAIRSQLLMARIIARLNGFAEQNTGLSATIAVPIRLEKVISLAAQSRKGSFISRMRRLAPRIYRTFDCDGCVIFQTGPTSSLWGLEAHAFSRATQFNDGFLQALAAHVSCLEDQVALFSAEGNRGPMMVIDSAGGRLVLYRDSQSPNFIPEEAELAGALWRALAVPEGKRISIVPEESIHLPLRVHQVLCCLINGMVEKQIASVLSISAHTVHVHIKRLYRQLGVTSRAELFCRCRNIRIHGPDHSKLRLQSRRQTV